MFAVACLTAISASWREGYPAGDIADGSIVLDYGCALTSAFAAFEFRGFARFVRPFRSTRSGVVVVLGAFSALLVGAPLTLLLATLVTARALPNDGSSWSIVLVVFATVLASVLVGFLLSWALPAVLAVPAAAVGWFVWLAYVPATGIPLLVNMNSTFFGCCSSDTQPATAAVLAGLTVMLVLSAGALALMARRRWMHTSRTVVALSTCVTLLVAFGAGASVARTSGRPLTLGVNEPRTTDLVCRTIGEQPVCLWPENAERATELASIVRRMNSELSVWTLPTITRVTERHIDPTVVSVDASNNLADADLPYSVASGYIDTMAGCYGAFGGRSGRARDERAALLMLAGGSRPRDVVRRFDPVVVKSADAQFERGRRSPAAVRAWFRAGFDQIHCPPGD